MDKGLKKKSTWFVRLALVVFCDISAWNQIMNDDVTLLFS